MERYHHTMVSRYAQAALVVDELSLSSHGLESIQEHSQACQTRVCMTHRKRLDKPGSNSTRTDAATARRRRAGRSAEYRAEEARLAAFEQIARMVIGRRVELDMTQEQLTERMDTSASTISRIESGQQMTSVTTLRRLASALEVKLLVGFETEAGDRELVSV